MTTKHQPATPQDLTPITTKVLAQVAKAREDFPAQDWKHHDELIRSHVRLELDRAKLIKALRGMCGEGKVFTCWQAQRIRDAVGLDAWDAARAALAAKE